MDLVTKIMVYAIFALSLELLVGMTGLVCFGHAAFFGIGAYAAVLLSPESDPANCCGCCRLRWARPRCTRCSWARLSLRTKGVYFIMVTLAFAQMAYYVVHDTPLGGGTDGIYLNAKPGRSAGTWLELAGRAPSTTFTLAWRWWRCSACWRCCCARRFGRALAGIRVNEQRMRATGFSTYPYKLAAFVMSGRHRRAGGLPVRGEGRLRQPRADELALVAARC
jgi:branched-chain amino acid transport system permease protein